MGQRGLTAGLVLGGALAIAVPAWADDWGCQVLLCLANPAGPTAVSQCVPPIEKLWESLHEGHSFPSCGLAGDSTSRTGSFAQPSPDNSYYNTCPGGLTALPMGSYAIWAPSWVPKDNTARWAQQQTLYAGIGAGTGLAPSSGMNYSSLPPEVCVGEQLGQVNYTIRGGREGFEFTANVYAQVTVLQPQASPNIINVYIDGALYNQVHW
jgi:hypothetical protein